ncbi:uncharacterized protein LOC110907700 [Helianthus annuus]|uniref:uncharacterized protein LOC110907700 n=1 Tax=Helianthus annuus TaxID=4232 RepID=UPI000B8F2657|nr:uncharacterized protein LOC110907700 [Helianthus annuus]
MSDKEPTPPSSPAATKQQSLHPAYTVTNIQTKVRILDGTKVSYAAWVKLFKLHAKAYKVLDHIDGSNPPEESHENHETWFEIDALVLQWIYGTVSDKLVVRILDNDGTARSAWVKLENQFLNNKGSRATTLEHEFTTLTIGACSSLEEYCQKLKEIADQLGDVGFRVSDGRLVMQLVRGLPAEYDVTAAIINQTSPSWDDACTSLQKEQQRQQARLNQNQSVLVSQNPNPTPTDTNTSNQPNHPPADTNRYPPNQYDNTRTRGRGRGYRGRGRGRSYRNLNQP